MERPNQKLWKQHTDLEKLVVDAVDYLEMTWQNALHHAAGPAFKSLGQNCVIRVREGGTTDFPGLQQNQKKFK